MHVAVQRGPGADFLVGSGVGTNVTGVFDLVVFPGEQLTLLKGLERELMFLEGLKRREGDISKQECFWRA